MSVSQFPTRFTSAHSGEASGPDHLVLIDVPPEYPSNTVKMFKDGGRIYSQSSSNVVERWDFTYNGLTQEEAAILDNHRIEAMDQFEDFSFRHPRTGILYTNVHYETFENPGHENLECQSRHIVLVRSGALVATSPALLVDGFLYRDLFASLTGWTSDGSWVVDSDSPAFVASAGSDSSVSLIGTPGGSDAVGVREFIILADSDTWIAIYDAGNGVPATSGFVWRMHYATSTNQGRSWTHQGPLSILFTNGGGGGDWATRACGFLERRGNNYFLHTLHVTTLDAGNEFPGGAPILSDCWSTTDPLANTWSFVREDLSLGASGEFDDTNAFAVCVIESSGTFYLFYGASGGGDFNLGIATGPSASGPWTKLSTDNVIPTAIAGNQENQKVFWSEELQRWCMLANQIASDHTDRTALYTSESLTDWTAAERYDIQYARPIDSTGSAVGVMAPIYLTEGLPTIGENGEIPVSYDGDSADATTGHHHDRKGKFTWLQPCPTALHYPTQDAVLRTMSRSFAHSDFVAEFEVDASAGHAYAQALFSFRLDGIDGSAGYRLISQFVTGSGATDLHLKLQQRTAAKTNYALASAGATATASSDAGANYVPAKANDGNRVFVGSNVNYWASSSGTPDHWLQIDFGGSKTINEIDVFTLQDDTSDPPLPTLSTTGTLFVIKDFDVQYWNGSSWVTITGGGVTSNNKVWRKFTFTPLSTTKIRVLVHHSIVDDFARIAELEAWGPPDQWTNIATGTGTYTFAPNADWAEMRRVRLSAQGATIKAWLDGELQINYTTANVLSGTAIALGAFDIDAHVRDLKIYKTDSITITNLTIGDIITLRGPGGVPLKQLTADSATEVVSHTSWPITSVQAGERVFAPAAGIWGGSTIQFVS